MPVYDYRCNQCGRRVQLFYKTYKDYDAATHTCPHCHSTDLTRLISRVAVHRSSSSFTSLSEDAMLSALESGDPREMGRLMQQLGREEPDLGEEYHEVTERLLRGEDPEQIERDLGGGDEATSDELM